MLFPRSKIAVLRVQLEVFFFTALQWQEMERSKQNQTIVCVTIFTQIKKYSIPKVAALMVPFLPEQKKEQLKRPVFYFLFQVK